MLNTFIKYFMENKLVTVLILIALITWGNVTAAFNLDTGYLTKKSVPDDAINMCLSMREVHSLCIGFDSELKNFLQHIQPFKTLEEIRKAFIPIPNTMLGITNAFKSNNGTPSVLHYQ
ncbi:MAG: DUF3347 domain-containing protein [Maribacter sp.]|nr:DUF3347 domain-containing protein [Maribacter sp.]